MVIPNKKRKVTKDVMFVLVQIQVLRLGAKHVPQAYATESKQ